MNILAVTAAAWISSIAAGTRGALAAKVLLDAPTGEAELREDGDD